VLDWFRIRLAAYVAIGLITLALTGLATHWLRTRSNQQSPRSLAGLRHAGPPPVPKLALDDRVIRGHVVEIQGRTDPDATVMINGQPVPLIFDHSGFKHFLLVPEGSSFITVTAMNRAGGVNTQRLEITTP
jgi:hypothetical protein